MAPPRPPDPTMTFYQLDGILLFCGDGSLSSRLRYLAAVLDRVGDEQSQAVIAEVQREIDQLQQRAMSDDTAESTDSLIRDRIQQVFANLAEAFAKVDRNRILALSMAEQLRHAGLPVPNGISDLILEGRDPSSHRLT